MSFYSQYGQDEWLYNNYFKGVKNGTFLEIGADDGVDKSNTKFFEDHLGWKGICVEPSPKRFKLLSKNRTCICEEVAVAGSVGTVEFLDISGWGKGLSGIIGSYHQDHVERIEWEVTNPQNRGKEIVSVKAELLNNILEKHQIFDIDFCSIDTEGSEFEILNAFDFEKFNVRIFLVENNYEESNVRELLAKNGYKFLGRVGPIDDVFIRE